MSEKKKVWFTVLLHPSCWMNLLLMWEWHPTHTPQSHHLIETINCGKNYILNQQPPHGCHTQIPNTVSRRKVGIKTSNWVITEVKVSERTASIHTKSTWVIYLKASSLFAEVTLWFIPTQNRLKILTRFDVTEGTFVCGTRGNNAGRGSNCKGLLASAWSVSTVMMFFSSSVQSNREFLSILAL